MKLKPSYLAFALLFCSFTLWFASCKKEPEKQGNGSGAQKSLTMSSPAPYFFSLADAQIFAEYINRSVFLGNQNKTTPRLVASSITINDKDNIPALYIFNYENNGGYVVMSADSRYEPICAFVEQGSIAQTDKIPSALGCWFGLTVENIEAIREGQFSGSNNENLFAWKLMLGNIYLQRMPTEAERILNGTYELNCNPYNYYFKDLLVQTNWGQGCTYNDQVPVAGCTNEFCGKAPTGCVATAGAQILRYWAAPSSYNYNYTTMPNTYGNSNVQRLMADVGYYVGMDWECDASGANTEELNHAFQNYYNYSSPGTYDDFESASRWVIKSDVDAGRPAVLDGCTDESGFLFWNWGSGRCHAWIVDGYRLQTNNCTSGRFHFHMNWGWDGQWNGYYYQNGEWPGSATYQYARNILHNIHP